MVGNDQEEDDELDLDFFGQVAKLAPYADGQDGFGEEAKGEENKLDFSRLLTDNYFQKPQVDDSHAQHCILTEAKEEPFDEILSEEVKDVINENIVEVVSPLMKSSVNSQEDDLDVTV